MFFVATSVSSSKSIVRNLYKVVSQGSRFSETTRVVVVPMVRHNGDFVPKEGVRIPLVFGKLLGFKPHVTDEEIRSVLGGLSEAERKRDFEILRKEFDEPNCAEVETWHKCGERLMSNILWTPFDSIPTDLL